MKKQSIVDFVWHATRCKSKRAVNKIINYLLNKNYEEMMVDGPHSRTRSHWNTFNTTFEVSTTSKSGIRLSISNEPQSALMDYEKIFLHCTGKGDSATFFSKSYYWKGRDSSGRCLQAYLGTTPKIRLHMDWRIQQNFTISASGFIFKRKNRMTIRQHPNIQTPIHWRGWFQTN